MASIEDAFADAGVGLPVQALEHLRAYLDLLLRWNQRLNLTAVREPSQIIRRHFVESAFAARELPSDVKSVLDYGSGAGFPGIPVAICRPDIAVTLAESQMKKATFLREVLRTLDLDVEVYAGRVEDMPAQSQFDAVCMRAVDKTESALPVALAKARHYLVLFTTEDNLPGLAGTDFSWIRTVSLPNATRAILATAGRD